MLSLTRNQARSVDQFAIEHIGVPGIVLMENAGRGATDAIVDLLQRRLDLSPQHARAAILCGGGNNGGDGYAIARHLHIRGVTVTIHPVVDPANLGGDAAVNHRICVNLGLDIVPILDASALAAAAESWEHRHVLVDALLGTGFHGEVRPQMAAVIDRVNALQSPLIVAVDVPSGLDCESGRPSNATITADLTVTFVAEKTAFAAPHAQPFLGRLLVADIGIPASVAARAVAAEP